MDDQTDETRTQNPEAAAAQWEVVEHAVTVDDFAARYDIRAVQHLLVDVPPEVMYRTLRHLDLLTLRSRTADIAMRVRGLPERIKRRVPPRVPTRLTFDDLCASGDWVLLGEQPGREVVFGAVGRFWTPIVSWEEVSAEDFADYGKPGRGKIVTSLSVRPYGRGGSLATYDVRTLLDDPITCRIFKLYWRTVSPFVKAIMRATLRAAAEQAHEATEQAHEAAEQAHEATEPGR